MMNMSEDENHEFRHWEELYEHKEKESRPCLNPKLDDDLGNALDDIGLRTGSALDLGTSPGSQAGESGKLSLPWPLPRSRSRSIFMADGKMSERVRRPYGFSKKEIVENLWPFPLKFSRVRI